jgi:hypothetical protein
MGIQRRKKNKAGIRLTAKKLELLIAGFLAKHEIDMAADYKPESEQWRQALASAIATHILKNTK